MSNVYRDTRTGQYYKIDENGRRVAASYKGNGAYHDTERLIKRSTTGNRTKAKPRTVKVYADRLKVAIIGLAMLCTVGGAVLTNVASNIHDSWQESQIVHEASMDFRKNAITDNTKRTQNNKYYYYEYDDIHDYIARDGADYSQEVYLAYNNLGEHQMDRLFDEGVYGGPDSLQEFVEDEGYKTVDDWAEAERAQLLLEHELDEKRDELRKMTGEIEDNARGELEGVLGDKHGK